MVKKITFVISEDNNQLYLVFQDSIIKGTKIILTWTESYEYTIEMGVGRGTKV